MGTDIHCTIERRAAPGEPWENVGGFPELDFSAETIDWSRNYRSRNYTWFAALADVRNGFGFAGVYRHEPLTPISSGRGIPEDATAATLAQIDPDFDADESLPWLGDHSFTYVTLAEILAYDWDQRLDEGGVVTMKVFRERLASQDQGAPEEYCGHVSGPSVRVFDSVEAVARILSGAEDGPQDHVRITWGQPLRSAVGGVLDLWTEYLSQFGDPENVRVIMGFDS